MIDWDLYGTITLRLALALLVGTILGLNRWLHHKSAGIRTHSLVAIGAATAIMLISDFVKDDAQSVSRVLQGLITGLGFWVLASSFANNARNGYMASLQQLVYGLVRSLAPLLGLANSYLEAYL